MFLRNLALVLILTPNFLYANHLSSEAQLSSDSIFRGVSRTDHSPAVAGRIHYAFDFGLKFGASITNIGADDARGFEAQPHLSYTYAIHRWLSLKAGLTYYYNPFATLADTADFQLGAQFGDYLQVTTFYSKKFFARKSSATYIVAETDRPVPSLDTLFVHLSGGYNTFSHEINAGNKNYLDYRVALHHRVGRSDIGLAVTGTNRRILDFKGLDRPAKDESIHAYYTIAL